MEWECAPNHIKNDRPHKNITAAREVIGLLQHFKILTILPDDSFFMACLLFPKLVEHGGETGPPPFLFGFKIGCIPFGVFPGLFIELMQQDWEIFGEQFRNQVQLISPDGAETTLTAHPQFIQVCVHDATAACAEVCFDVRSSIVSAIRSVLDLYDHTKGMEISQGFYCPRGEFATPHFAYCPGITKRERKVFKRMICAKSEKSHNIEARNLVWCEKVQISCNASLLHSGIYESINS